MSDFFVVTVISDGPSTVQLLFNRGEKAREVYTKLVAKDRGEAEFEIEAEDDFGTCLMVNRDRVVSIAYSDVNRQHEGQAEAQLMAHRANAKLQKRAAQDPTLQLLTPNMPPNGMMRA
jgi:hypothetical protein